MSFAAETHGTSPRPANGPPISCTRRSSNNRPSRGIVTTGSPWCHRHRTGTILVARRAGHPLSRRTVFQGAPASRSASSRFGESDRPLRLPGQTTRTTGPSRFTHVPFHPRPGSPTSRFTLLEKLNASARVPRRRIHPGFEPGGGHLSEPSRRWRVRREGHTHEKSPGLTPGLVADSSRTIRAERLGGPASGRDKVSDAPSGSLEDQLPPPLVVVGEAGGFGRVGTGGVGTFTLADCWMADGIPTGITTVLATTEAAAGSNIWPPHTS